MQPDFSVKGSTDHGCSTADLWKDCAGFCKGISGILTRGILEEVFYLFHDKRQNVALGCVICAIYPLGGQMVILHIENVRWQFSCDLYVYIYMSLSLFYGRYCTLHFNSDVRQREEQHLDRFWAADRRPAWITILLSHESNVNFYPRISLTYSDDLDRCWSPYLISGSPLLKPVECHIVCVGSFTVSFFIACPLILDVRT